MDSIKSDVHPKTIIHIDIDCFYAQVELLKRPHLQNEPVGVKQKNIVVTCNYVARRLGVKKCMLISEALQICPDLVLFNGEDLYKYRQASNQIHLFLLSFTSKVEKSGFDENYLDVTDLVKERELKHELVEEIEGHCIGDPRITCACGCHRKLSIASQLASEIRRKLKSSLGFTSCCGISYNKLLAKISCSVHKPNEQTTLLPNGAVEFLQKLNSVDRLPGVGVKFKKLLDSVNVRTVKDLQEIDLKNLKKVFKNEETAITVKNLSLGICDAMVKPSGKPHSIGLEDGFKKISVECEVKEKFRILLQRLMILVREDGRIPTTIKVTVRKHDSEKKISNKETKQSPVQTYLFGYPVGKLTEDSTNKLLGIIMSLFCKMVNTSKPFHITLLGLAVSKFREKVHTTSIASFLLSKRDLSVQSPASFISNESSMEVTNPTDPGFSKPESDSETEPSPKKTKFDVIIKKKNFCEDIEMYSPSKLNVENLNISEGINFLDKYQSGVDPKVFEELPQDLQNEIIQDLKMTYSKKRSKYRCKQSLIKFYCVPKNEI